jgi:predicted CXXCH cytochrome family protein
MNIRIRQGSAVSVVAFILAAAFGVVTRIEAQAKPAAAPAAQKPVVPAAPQKAPAPQTAAPGSCLQCHVALTKRAVSHEAVSDCSACHVQEKGNLHRFKPSAEGGKMCAPCHDLPKTTDKYVHGPVAVGDCLACHDPHGSANPKLLKMPGSKLCENCHEEMTAKLAAKRYVHAPVKADCAGCHDPHSSRFRYQLKSEGTVLCLSCHKATEKLIASSPVKHDAVKIGKACLGCHEPHASDIQPALRASSAALCLSCHDKQVDAPGGPVQDIKAWLAANPNLHGPIKQQDCVGCHKPHEAEHFRLLKQDYPAKFYSPFEPKNYELCFNCHQPDLVRLEKTVTLTGFRDGDRNLHYLHVNRPEKGRTCRACHEAHSSSEPKHLRKTVPFGSWPLPIKFEPAADGGKCAPGCHVAYEYRRSAKPAADAARKH